MEYYRLARALCELDRKGCGVDFYHYNLDLTGGPCAAKRLTGCGAGCLLYTSLDVNSDSDN